jgi:hypothetical protein
MTTPPGPVLALGSTAVAEKRGGLCENCLYGWVVWEEESGGKVLILGVHARFV